MSKKNISEITQDKIDEVIAALSDTAIKMKNMEKYLDNIDSEDEFEAALNVLGEHKQSFLDVYHKMYIFPNIYACDLDEDYNENEDW
jgi:predicted HD phosphohydrolase